MVNPDADNTTSIHSSDSIGLQRNIPASCHKHTVQKSRSVKKNLFFVYFLMLYFDFYDR